MTPRQTIKRLVTPVLADLLRGKNRYIWRGVFPSFAEVPARGDGHATKNRIETVIQRTTRLRKQLSQNELTVDLVNSLPPQLVALQHLPGRQYSILDVGGALGVSYLYLRALAPQVDKLHYEVVEVEPLAKAGSELFADDRCITFRSNLPGEEAVGKFDLIQFCGSLQYIEDYNDVIQRVCRLGAPFIYVLKVMAGEFETFATAQYNLPETVCPVWFFNKQSLLTLFANGGYKLSFHSRRDRTFDTTNFEPEYRISEYSHLLFARNT